MTSLLKSFGKGLLYIFVLPILVVVLAVYAVIGVGMFIYIGLKGLFLFFTGRNLQDLPEDIKAKEILEGKNKIQPEVVEVTPPEVTPTSDYASHYYVPLDQNIPAPKEEAPENKGEEQ